MIKLLNILFLFVLCSGGTIIRPVPSITDEDNSLDLDHELLEIYSNESEPWKEHVMDFVRLVDMEKVMGTIVKFIDDPEVMRFVGFLLSPKLKDMVWETENMQEFKEAYLFLLSKGYNLKEAIDIVNTGLSLPQFNQPEPTILVKNSKGVTGFLAAILGSLPIQEMRELLKNKIENYPEVAEFIDAIRSEEFKGIIKRMITSPTFAEFKSTFESYGVDFHQVCLMLKEIFQDEHPNMTCDYIQTNILF